MFIMSNIEGMTAHRNLVQIDRRFNKSMERLSSGLNFPKPEFGGGFYAMGNDMEAIYREYLAGAANVQDAKGWLSVAQSAMIEINDMMMRMNELAHRAATETTNTDQRVEMNEELQALKSNIQIIASDSKFNEISVFGAGQIGQSLSIVFGENRVFHISTYSMTLLDLNISDAVISNAAAAQLAMGSIEIGINTISGLLAKMGAQILEIEAKADVLDEQGLQEAAMKSRVTDLDFAKEMKEFTAMQVVLQASQAMVAQANMKPQMITQLFG